MTNEYARLARTGPAVVVHALMTASLIAILTPRVSADDPVSQNGPRTQDLTQMGIEDLMKIQVTTASKKAQPLSAMPAAVYVITQEDIRRSGVRSIPEALRLAPGVQVAQIDSNKWAISIRGFNNRFADKLLVLIDGRSVYTPLFSGVYWDAQDTLIEDIDRIEVVRGPSASLWGANAVNGVINIITKSAKDTQGVLATLGAGDMRRGEAAYRFGSRLGDTAHYRVFGKYSSVSDSLYEDGTRGKDGWDSLRGGFRVDWDKSTAEKVLVEGEVSGSNEGQRSTFPILSPPYTQTVDGKFPVSGWHLLGRWTRTGSSGSETSLQAYYDRSQRSIPEVFDERDTFDLDLQHHFAAGRRTTLTAGMGFRRSSDNTQAGALIQYIPANRADNLYSAFLHSETAVAPKLNLTLGARIEHNDYTGFEIQPNVRLAWSPTDHRTLWGAVSRAARTPSRSDANIDLITQTGPDPQSGLPSEVRLLGSPTFRSEEVTAYELGYRTQPSGRDPPE